MATEAVVVDANVAIGLCAAEPDKLTKAKAALEGYVVAGCPLYAPSVIVAEVLYVLCKKVEAGTLTPADHPKAVDNFVALMASVLPPPAGDAALILRAEAIRGGRGCAQSADSLYLALAEELAGPHRGFSAAVLLTFDEKVAERCEELSRVRADLLVPDPKP